MRQNGSNGQKIDRLDKDVNKLKQEMEKSREQFERHLEMHIIDDLNQPRFQGSPKPMYTYDEVAERHGVSKSRVQRVAESNGLTRRGKNIG